MAQIPRKIYESAGNIAGAVWAPNGKSIAFAMSSAEALETYEVYIMDLETLTVGPVTKGHVPNAGGSVDWSPDGRSLLLFAGPPGDKNIFLFDIVSGHVRQLTNGGNNAAPVFSPDGRWVAFNSQRNGNADIFIMKPDGSDVRQLTNDPEPTGSPGGEFGAKLAPKFLYDKITLSANALPLAVPISKNQNFPALPRGFFSYSYHFFMYC